VTRKSPRRFKCPVSKAIHSSASTLQRVGAISKATMREFDESRLATPPALAPRQIKRLRERQHVSQPVFARSTARAMGSTVARIRGQLVVLSTTIL